VDSRKRAMVEDAEGREAVVDDVGFLQGDGKLPDNLVAGFAQLKVENLKFCRRHICARVRRLRGLQPSLFSKVSSDV
jgi:hypothetical protein